MQDSKLGHNNRKVSKVQAPSLGRVTSPQLVSELLTLREAAQRFGIDRRQIYVWAQLSLLHPVRPHGRVLYPEWELSELVKRLYRSGFDLQRVA